MNRRSFLSAADAATVTGIFTRQAMAQTPPPSGKLGHACIGVGGMGAGDLNSLVSHPRIQIVALCDVDKNALATAAKKVPGAITVSALRARKHVDCQKPLCHDIAEIAVVMREAQQSGCVKCWDISGLG